MVHEADLPRFYESLKSAASKTSSNTLHIFISGMYVDSLVALKILTDMLRSDSIMYSVFPVYGYSDMVAHSDKGMSDSTQPYVAVFINCGATEYLPNLQNSNAYGDHTKIFILDSHRPIHLSNLSSQQVIVAWTKSDQDQEGPILSNLEKFSIDSDEEGSDYENDYSDDADDCDGDSSDDDKECDDEESEEDEDEAGVASEGKEDSNEKESDKLKETKEKGYTGKKRKRSKNNPKRDKQRMRMEYYNRGSFHGRSTGYLLYEMANSLHKDTNEHLWLACVALTDQYVHSRLANEKYLEACMELEQHINASGNLEVPKSVSLDDGTRVKIPDLNRISYDKEWNLFECMQYSTYPCTKLKTWSKAGLRKLKLFFAQLGIRHSDAMQKYMYMNSKAKQLFKQELDKVGPQYGLTGFSYQSFQRLHGYKMKVSAADMVYGLTAILESCDTTSHESRTEAFWKAISAMDLRGWKMLEEGMDMAINVQSAIVRHYANSMNKGDCKNAFNRTNYQLLILNSNSSDIDFLDLALLAHPLALTRFIHFFMDAQQESGKKPKPMVVSACSPNTSRAIVVGVSLKPKMGDFHGNTFGIQFAKATERLSKRIDMMDTKQDMFESSYCELHSDKVNLFFRELSHVINQRL